ncbi:phytoene desaturase family protein [Halobacillus salinarum]|uniref:4,4'-diaponeurosporene oxygenase n=1 Tax=Halobacillus salinarum TaxID=2932257 RepID=A0ABY4EGR2_9BACI|nr:phytoene desaturase family protein [Halobacillus salinarum]UOQ43242.1 phytoene desaturase family protein [Halobacillus salinarum]
MKVIIIGGGLGGLSAAVTLARHGASVKLFEKNPHFGGKMMPIDLDGYHFDFGPNTITMPEVFKEVFTQGGLAAKDQPVFEKIERHTRNQFPDGGHFDFSSDHQDMKNQIAALEPGKEHQYDSFTREVERLYNLSKQSFLNRTFSSWKDYLSPSLAAKIVQVKPWQNMDSFFAKYFSHPYIRQSLNRYATYIGSSPFHAPATFAMIAHLELNQGVYYVRGGNTKIAEAFVKAAKKQGAELYNNTKIQRITTANRKVTGVVTQEGDFQEADYVILNGDLLHSIPELIENEKRNHLSDDKINSYDPSTSAFVLLAGLNKRLDQLHHHHLLFSADYHKEFNSLKNGDYPTDPTIYISTSSKSDPTVSPYGDNCFLLVNAPPVGAGRNDVDPEEVKERIYSLLNTAGIPIKNYIQAEEVWTPEKIASQFGAFKGAIYGPSSNNKRQAFMRPFNRSLDFSNLYFCGGSTHPGGGAPLVVLSGQNVANQLLGRLVIME